MKKIFTLICMALVAMSVNAQDVYDAIVDGKLAPEFAAVAGEDGGVANNTTDGKSIVTMTGGKATVTAVGGTTPANADGGGQLLPIHRTGSMGHLPFGFTPTTFPPTAASAATFALRHQRSLAQHAYLRCHSDLHRLRLALCGV